MKIATAAHTPARVRTAVISAATAAALTVGAFAVPTSAQAAPAPAQAASALSAGSSLVDHLGRPTPQVQRAVKDFANRPGVPPQVRDALLSGLAFFVGDASGNGGGPGLPEGGPAFRQGFWPTVSRNCMGPGMNSTGSLIAVPGPAHIPVPAPKAGQATFVFLSLIHI